MQKHLLLLRVPMVQLLRVSTWAQDAKHPFQYTCGTMRCVTIVIFLVSLIVSVGFLIISIVIGLVLVISNIYEVSAGFHLIWTALIVVGALVDYGVLVLIAAAVISGIAIISSLILIALYMYLGIKND